MTKREALEILVLTWIEDRALKEKDIAKIRSARQFGESFLETILRVIGNPAWTPALFPLNGRDMKDVFSRSQREAFDHQVRLAAAAAALDEAAATS